MNCKSVVGCQLVSPIKDFKHHRIGGGLMAMGTQGDSRRRFRVIAGNKSDQTSYADSYIIYSIYIKKSSGTEIQTKDRQLSAQDLRLHHL